MNSLKKSILFAFIKSAAFIFMVLPMGVSLWIGRSFGLLGYYFLSKKRKVVYANLKTVYASTLSPRQLRLLTKKVFINFVQSAVEFLCLPKMKRLGFEKFVDLQSKENIDHALKFGKGVVLLAIHSGSWELASVVGGITNSVYHVVANDQSKIPKLDGMLNEYRTIAGAHVITAGRATKGIIKAMQANHVVSLVLDQGGKTGVEVPFFNKTASMSTGAMRLALKYGSAVCPVWMERLDDGKHVLKILPHMALTQTGDMEKDIAVNVAKAASFYDSLLREHPAEYMWFYKVFKYSHKFQVLIIDDGRTGHLRQSQALAGNLCQVLKKKGGCPQENTVSLQWRSPRAESIFRFYAFFAQYLGFLKREDFLKYFLSGPCFNELMKYKADFVVSCGSQAAGVNFILKENHSAKSISILTPGLVSPDQFDVVVMLEHDKPKNFPRARLIVPKVAPNLINAAYLKEQGEGLLKYYSHLKGNVRTKFGLLIGGDTKEVKFNEIQIRKLIEQVKEAAQHYNADILVTTSRRTPAAIEQIIVKELKSFDRCSLCIIANQRNIPEAVGGILSLSDLVVVSGESISMVSEALSSAKRTIVFTPHGRYGEKARDKYEDFVLKLNDLGLLMLTSVDDLNSQITRLLSRKIVLKQLDDQSIIQTALEAIV